MVAPVQKIPFTCLYCGKDAVHYVQRPRQFCSTECYKAHKSAAHHVQKTCIICGAMFEGPQSRIVEQITCRSEACKKAAQFGEHNNNAGRKSDCSITCLQCNKIVEVTPSESDRKFCSRVCQIAYYSVQKTCIICGKPFKCTQATARKQTTCLSDECKKATKVGEHNPFYGRSHSEESKAKVSKAKTKPRTEIECTCGCGEMVSVPGWRQRKNKKNVFFADIDHMKKWLTISQNHWNYRGGSVYYGDGWHKIAKAVRERDKVCQMCGKTPEENGRALDVHHKVPVRVSQDNSMDNLVALCMSCHQSLQTSEQFDHPYKVNRYRVCLICDKAFIPEAFQKICSDECRRKGKRQYEKRYLDTHPEAMHARLRRIKDWQHKHPLKMAEYRRQGRVQ